jgi:hypothetical protein
MDTNRTVEAPKGGEPLNLPWLIESRSQIQASGVELLNFLKDSGSKLELESEPTQTHLHVAFLLVGTAFALWRACFLPHTHQDMKFTLKTAQDFLEHVIRHNTVAYSQESTAQTWSFGYYLNNAKFRFREICKRLTDFRVDLQTANLLHVLGEPTLSPITDSQAEWDSCHAAFKLALTRLKSNLESAA